VTTAIVSDLHLGDTASLLGSPHARGRLVSQLEEADQVVVLGDALALRAGPVHEVLEAARPFFEELGDALRGRRVVIVHGNHDHQLVQPLIERRRLEGDADPLELEWIVDPGTTGPAGTLARFMGDAEVAVAYPGLWLRPDVYATHGHYLDCHITFPRPESLLAGLMEALGGPLPEAAVRPDHYEAVLAPLYALAHGRAQNGLPTRGRRAGAAQRRLTKRTLSWLNTGGRASPRRVAVGAVAYGAIAVANRAGLDRFRPDLSIAELDRAGVRAMGEVLERLGVDAPYVVFGHTHRGGPREGEDGWSLPNGTRLVNTGSWVYSSGLLGDDGRDSPYWPGTYAVVGDDGPPEMRRVLDGTGA
jgi:calcineurin-like phosphoesterase family protein